MLFQLIDQVCARIDTLDIIKDAPEFARHVKKANPNFLKDLKIGPQQDEEKTLNAFCAVHIGIIKTVKKAMIEPMVKALKNERTPLHIRYALAYSLAYFVNPNDLIPDDTSGGYGFVDDHIIIRAAYIEYLSLEGKKAEDINNVLNFATLVIPKDILPAIRDMVKLMSTAIQLCKVLPADILKVMINVCISNPLAATTQQQQYTVPAGFNPIQNINFDPGKIGNWETDNGNIYYGGQAAVHNGQVYVF